MEPFRETGMPAAPERKTGGRPKIRMTTEQIPKTDPITAPAVRTVIWIIISMMTRMMIIRMKAGISILTAIPVRIRIMIPGRI